MMWLGYSETMLMPSCATRSEVMRTEDVVDQTPLCSARPEYPQAGGLLWGWFGSASHHVGLSHHQSLGACRRVNCYPAAFALHLQGVPGLH